MKNNCFLFYYIFLNVIYFRDAMLNFPKLLLQSKMSHDPSEIIPICLFGAILLLMLKTVVLLTIFVYIIIIFHDLFFQDPFMKGK